jgi:DNA-binding transcriptional LysR family regulator
VSYARSAHEPRVTCVDFMSLRDAAVTGLGVALLPDHNCRGELASGRLVHVFPQWRTEDGIVHLVFTARRDLLPVERAFIDHLAGAFRNGNVAAEATAKKGAPTIRGFAR